MRCVSLSSGSKGNCFYVENNRDALIFDAGISMKEILKRLDFVGGDPELVRAIFITHEHVDHIRGALTFSKKFNIPLYATEGTIQEIISKAKYQVCTNLLQCKPDFPISIENFKIESTHSSHDSKDPCSFRVSSNDMKIVYCTDTGLITRKMFDWFNSCNILAIECNHDHVMLENGPYTDALKQRIRSTRGHLSNLETLSCIKSIAHNVDHVLLIHVSETNNTMEKVEKVVVENAHDLVDITVAPYPDKIAPWIKI